MGFLWKECRSKKSFKIGSLFLTTLSKVLEPCSEEINNSGLGPSLGIPIIIVPSISKIFMPTLIRCFVYYNLKIADLALTAKQSCCFPTTCCVVVHLRRPKKG